ncbi:MAG: rane dipeptidase [Gammaproteobacteria bacterium]|jgi:membrane dipeptidase|nr:rane dipeptidase [Gammaproteobacteria bacterium]
MPKSLKFPDPIVAVAVLLCVPLAAWGANPNYEARVDRVLAGTPLIDGHNDLPWEIRSRFKSDLAAVDLKSDTARLPFPPDAAALMTDIPRLHAGKVGGQFWSVWVPVDIKGFEAVQATLEQIDLVKRMCERYPDDLAMAYSAADVRRIHQSHKIACLIGIEGGHQINDSLGVLRQMHAAGARYMTLTHTTNTDWADSATDTPVHHGLTAFGEEVVREMNRLGMLVDISHVSPDTMKAALRISEAPVIFSHSSARALVDHPRNVPDDILRTLGQKGGVVMVNFATGYVSAVRNDWNAAEAAERTRFNSPPFVGLYIGQPERAKAALAEWVKDHPRPAATLAQVADHIEHIRLIAGVDHVGLGSDFDGIEDTPSGLEGVGKYPALLMELMNRGWTDTDVAKLAGGNVLRVMAEAERVAATLRGTRAASGMMFSTAKPQ